MRQHKSVGLALLLTMGAAFAVQLHSDAQRTKTVGTKKQQEKQKVQTAPFHFGDITLRNYANISGNSDEVHVTGPKVLVDSVDPKTGGSSHIAAKEFVATQGEDGVDKIDAIGAMTFNGERPATGRKGMQKFEASGSKATYFKKSGKLEIWGPVNYYVEQPTVIGDEKQWVRGTARHAVYDEIKKVLTLTGDVDAKVMDPSSLQKGKPSSIVADEAILDFGKPKVTFEFKNNNPDAGEVKINPKEEPRKEIKKKDNP
jgi:hypothetical protein